MRMLRRAILWAGLVVMAGAAAMAVVGAFLGAERTSALVNSLPAAVFWTLFALVAVSPFLAFKRMWTSPGRWLTHAGLVVLVCGAMWGSRLAHRARRDTNGGRIPEGYVELSPGAGSNILFTEQGRPAGELPFYIRLDDAWTEYHAWRAALLAPPAAADDQMESLDLAVAGEGAVLSAPERDVRVEVVRWIDRARPVYADRPGELTLTPADGGPVSVPAVEGETLSVGDPPITVRVLRVFSNLTVEGSGDDRRLVDAPGRDVPAVELEFVYPGGETDVRYVFEHLPGRAEDPSGRVQVSYRAAPVVGAEPDPSAHHPAARVDVHQGDRRATAWVLVDPDTENGVLTFAEAFDSDGPSTQPADDVLALALFPGGMAKQYYARLSAIDAAGKTLAEQTVRVNRPLMFGGHAFYVHTLRGRQVLLMVTSNAGVAAVFVGAVMVLCGVVATCWVAPAWRRLAGRRTP